MVQRVNAIMGIVLLISHLLVMPSKGAAAKDDNAKPPSAAAQAYPLEALNLGDLIPRAAQLNIRLAELERKLTAGADRSKVETDLSVVAAELDENDTQLKQLQASEPADYTPLVRIRQDIQWQQRRIEKASRPLSEVIRQMAVWRKAWLLESRRWQQISSELMAAEQPDEVTSTLTGAQATIANALGLIRQALQPVLALQKKAADLNLRAESMTAEIDRLIRTSTGGDRAYTYPPLVSSEFFSQVKSVWHHQGLQGFGRVDWNIGRLLTRYGWLIALQLGLVLVLSVGIHRKRKTLERTERLQFLVKRPFAAGIFVAIEPFLPFYLDGPAWWMFLLLVGAGIGFLRLTADLFKNSWKKRALYALVFILISARSLLAFALLLPIVRLYLVLVSAVGIYFCLGWARIARRQGDGLIYIVGLRLVACGWALVLVTELWGKSIGAGSLLLILSDTLGLTLGWWLLMRSTQGFVEWVVRRSDWQLPDVVRKNPEAAIQRTAGLVNTLFGLAYLCAVLVIWRIYPDPVAAFTGLLSLGVSVGSQWISVGLVLKAAALAYGAFLTSWVIQRLFLKKVYDRHQVNPGDRFSINRLITIAFAIAGVLLALGALGVKLTQLTIMISALGVGIGFGLQGIVNNFMCGLILLFEQPVRVGDTIELETGQWAEVKKIGLRASQIRTYDNADVILPNNDLISGRVTNWTLSSRTMRLRIAVGVAYGSDVPLVIETLLACAKDHTGVAARPDPQVLFLSFGDSSLDFELRVWVLNFDDHLRIKSEMCQQIDQRFRQAGIEIAFPQRDLHLRSVDELIRVPQLKPAE